MYRSNEIWPFRYRRQQRNDFRSIGFAPTLARGPRQARPQPCRRKAKRDPAIPTSHSAQQVPHLRSCQPLSFHGIAGRNGELVALFADSIFTVCASTSPIRKHSKTTSTGDFHGRFLKTARRKCRPPGAAWHSSRCRANSIAISYEALLRIQSIPKL